MKNGKLLLSLFLSALVLYNTLRVSFTYIYYNVDPIGFVEALCENKDKPELACNGKCHLKKVTESTQNEEKPSINLIDFKDILLYKSGNTVYNFKIKTVEKKAFFWYLNDYKYQNSSSCFHPPNT